MARNNNDRYVRFYTFGSTAAKVEQERRASLPKYSKPPKRKPIPFDPVAFAGSTVAVLLAVLMVVCFFQVAHVTAQVHEVQTQIMGLEKEQQMLEERYESGYDLNEIRTAAATMGMVSAEEANHIRVQVPGQVIEIPAANWWESVVMSLRQFLA